LGVVGLLWVTCLAHGGESGDPPRERKARSTDWRQHWAYQPPIRRAPPLPARNPIDAFLESARRAQNLQASPPLSKELWLRRVTLDLVGLLPTVEELNTFREDASDEAREKVVERFLANPKHGERWARHWMDIWRYSDWYGLGDELRFSHYHIWRWRDWIVENLNANTGYDRMLVAMLAGDEVAPESPETLRATGFLVRNWDTFNRNKWLDTTVEHTARAFLGVTIQCARCHDHKFDPVSQADYFRMRAIFEPYQIRIDRVPGQPDRTKDGIVRTFDDYLEAATYLFIRGDEMQPDKTHALPPSMPAVLGGSLDIRPIALPPSAFVPDKKPFVIEEARAHAGRAVADAQAAVEKARRGLQDALQEMATAEETERNAQQALLAEPKNEPPKSEGPSKAEKQAKAEAPRAAAVTAIERAARARVGAARAPALVQRAEAAVVVAEARRTALAAVLQVESLEEQGLKQSGKWAEAARATVVAQRRLALAEATSEQLTNEQAVAQASNALDGLVAASVDPKDTSLKSALERATTALVESRTKLAASTRNRTAAAATLEKAPGTDYTPRPLEFPRAKITYRDTPTNAPYARTSTGRRSALAQWLIAPRNPLTARVAVNHIWARHFGEPLVPLVYDFGLRSPRPVHQELLDWLAVEFMESGWSMKHLHRLMVTSDAYAMRSSSGGPHDANRSLDPDNHYYWRMNPRRMEAEVIRDSLLQAAGRLDARMGGPDLPVAAAEEGLRRTLYYRYTRLERIPFLNQFDAPNPEECYRRHETIVPQQALAMVNSKMTLERADEIVRAMTRELGELSESSFVRAAFERLLGRAPSEAEQAEALQGLVSLGILSEAGSEPTLPAHDQARSALVHVLLNHNDFVMIR
jgi:hypothetical protein